MPIKKKKKGKNRKKRQSKQFQLKRNIASYKASNFS